VAVELPQGVEVLHREVAVQRQGGVERRGCVALAQDEVVAVLPVRVVGTVLHDVEVERGDDIGGRKRPPGVPRSGVVDRLDDVSPDLSGPVLQSLDDPIFDSNH